MGQIGQNSSTSARTFKFEATYSGVDDCRTPPIVVTQKKVEEVWGRIEITISNSYGPDITFQQRGAISVVDMRQESNLENVRTLANGDFDIANNGRWEVHEGLKIDSIDDDNRTCIVSLNRDDFSVEQEMQVSIYFYYKQDDVEYDGVCTLNAWVDLNGDGVLA